MSMQPVIRAFGQIIDDLRRVDTDQLSPTELRDGLASLKAVESQLGAQLARLTHDADRRNAHVGSGARDTAEWLANETGTSTRKNRASAELGEAMAKSDELADAVSSGAISSDKAAAAVGAAGGDVIDTELLDEIADVPLPRVRPATEQWRARNRPDAETDRAARRRAKRFVRLTNADDGMTRVDGLLDPASATIVRTTLDSIISQSAFDDTDRTRDQRRADALTQLCTAASKGDIVGGRSNARVLATAPIDTITNDGRQPGRAHDGTLLDADTIRRMCCDAGIHRVISGPGSSILDFGHETRLVSDNLFLALVARDQHCRYPGCSIRATWCDAHHLDQWQHGGRTAEDTCALFCHHHHSVLHQPGVTVSGNAHRFTIQHPDGTTVTSQPPPPIGHPPPIAARRADTPPGADGHETTIADVITSLNHALQQLELV